MSTKPPSSKARPGGQRKTYGNPTKQSRRELEAARRRAQQRTALFVILAAIVVIGGGALGVVLAGGSHGGGGGNATTQTTAQPTQTGPEGAPVPNGQLLAASNPSGDPIDGISCGSTEQLAYHIHPHLEIFVNGKPVQIPAGVGITGARPSNSANGVFVSNGKCFYWIHTHAADGIIHVESPTTKRYTLANFFDIWGQPLSQSQVGTASGVVTAFVDGKPFTGNPADIVLSPNTEIQLDVGTPVVPYQPFTFPKNL